MRLSAAILKNPLKQYMRGQKRLYFLAISAQTMAMTNTDQSSAGKLRVPAGKTLNDGELFQTLDYYVDGISGKIPG